MNISSPWCWNSRSLLWAVVILAISAAFCLLDARPQMAHARCLTEAVATERAECAARYQSLETLARTQKETAVLAARVADFDSRIPGRPMLGNFLEELARLAAKHNLQSDTVQPGETVRDADLIAQPLAIKVRGSFSDLHALLQDIEHMPRLTRFEQLKVASDPEHPGAVTAELNLRIFYLQPENEAGTG
jgi:Tfp pilus assembly protein PilO